MCVVIISIISGFLMFWKLPTPKQTQDVNENLPLVSIIIPARNEARRIKPLLNSLSKQSLQAFELIVVDDESTDQTAFVAKRYGAKVISNTTSLEGWAGKSRACWNGALSAQGRWLLFLDADTEMTHKDSLIHLLSSFQEAGARGIMAIQPYHETKKLYEQASAIFNIIVVTGMNVFSIWKDRFETAGAFGPCILSDRDDYFKSGGHEHIQEAIMDDLALGIEFKKAGLPVHCYGGKGIISFRMYPEGFRQLVEGWTKNFATASQSTHPIIMGLINLWIAGGMMSVVGGGLAIYAENLSFILLSGMLYVIYMIQLGVLARRTGNFKIWIFLFHPLLLSFFTVIFLYSLYRTHVRHSVSWRGRQIKV